MTTLGHSRLDANQDAALDASPGRASKLDSKSPRTASWTWGVFLIGLILALAPLWWTYLVWTWHEGHYQYFPMLLGFVALLYWVRLDDCRVYRTSPSNLWVAIGMTATVLATAAGLLLYSGFIGILATILAVWVLTYAALGRGGMLAMAPVICLLFLAVPLPLGLDNNMIFKMQFLASNLATWLLDGAGVMHVRQGVILVTENARYMTEDACSGVRSLFSSLAVVACYSVAARHWWLRTVLNLIQAVVWVLIGNAIRVALTVVLADHVSTWFAAGAGHEFLSLFVFAFILAMIASTDRIFCSMFDFCFNSDWDGVERQFEKPTPPTSNPSVASSAANTATFFPPLALPVWCGVFVVLAMVVSISMRVAWVQSFSTPLLGSSMPRLPASRETDLPELLEGWQLDSFEHVQREGSNLFASDSYTWNYRNGPLSAVLSVDCPWAEWHNLQVCYTASGWDCQMQSMLPPPPDSPNSNLAHSEIALTQPGTKRGLVIFNAVDANGQDVLPAWRHRAGNRGGFFAALRAQCAASLGLGIDKQFEWVGNALPASTIQLYSEHVGDYTDAELVALRNLFFSARSALLESSRWKPQS